MVLTLAALCPPIRKQLDPATVSESWHCLNFLNRTIEHEPESFKYLQALKEISRYVNPENSGEYSQRTLKGRVIHEYCRPLKSLHRSG